MRLLSNRPPGRVSVSRVRSVSLMSHVSVSVGARVRAHGEIQKETRIRCSSFTDKAVRIYGEPQEPILDHKYGSPEVGRYSRKEGRKEGKEGRKIRRSEGRKVGRLCRRRARRPSPGCPVVPTWHQLPCCPVAQLPSCPVDPNAQTRSSVSHGDRGWITKGAATVVAARRTLSKKDMHQRDRRPLPPIPVDERVSTLFEHRRVSIDRRRRCRRS